MSVDEPQKWAKLHINLPIRMAAQLDERAEEIGIGRSALIRLLIHNYLKEELK